MIPQIGTGSAGEGAHQVRVTTVLGDRDGAVGTSWVTAISTPSAGHSPFVVLARPNLPVVPLTLFVPGTAIDGQRHLELTHGAAHAGVAAAVLDLQMDDPDSELCLIASVWVDPDAASAGEVYQHTHDAAVRSLKMGAGGGPWHGHLIEVEGPENDHFPEP